MQAYIDIYLHPNDITGSEKLLHCPYLENRLTSSALTPFKVNEFCYLEHEFSSVSNAQCSTQALILQIKEDLKGFGNLIDKQADNLTDDSTDDDNDSTDDDSTDIPTDNSTDNPTDGSTENLTDSSTDDSTDNQTDNHSGKQTACSLPDSHLSKQLEARANNCQTGNADMRKITVKSFCHATSVGCEDYTP